MNPLRILTRLKNDPHMTEIKGKNHRLSYSNRLFEVAFQFSQSDHDAFEQRAQAIETELSATLDATGEAYDATVAEAKRTASLATNEAHAKAKAAKWALFGDFFRLPSREEIAIAETPVGQVVRVESRVPLSNGERTATTPPLVPQTAG